MNPVIGDVVIVRRLTVDATGDDNDPAIVNMVRLVDRVETRDSAGRLVSSGIVGSGVERDALGVPVKDSAVAGSAPGPSGQRDAQWGPGSVMPSGPATGPSPTATEKERLRREASSVKPPSGKSPAEDAANQAQYAEAVRLEEANKAKASGEPLPLKEGESRPVETPKPIAPHAFISATVFSENGRTRFVRGVPFFESREDSDLWPKAPVSPTNVDAGLVAFPKAVAD